MTNLETAKIVFGTTELNLVIKTWAKKTLQQIIKAQSDYLGLPKTSTKITITSEGEVIPLTSSLLSNKTYTVSLAHEVLG
jgi:hypothetical protein